ncbi:class I SAM-dependent methyltransferase [Streptomyces sp. NPDC051896]|uniref:class I SAM-dependent methyltransferase n=1 Tax=Streptomyces sp. NPDC051896 TaxID=3155416 RepID=UPI003434533C
MSTNTSLDMAVLQQAEHACGHDYAKGSPHLLHHTIRDRIVRRIHGMVGEVIDQKGRCRVVEIGAGHGAFTDHLLAAGAEVEVTEMSAPSAEFLAHRYRHSPRVRVVHDVTGEAAHHGEPVDAVVCISVLHHIPDYLGGVDRLTDRVAPGGFFLSFQDPLWYPRRSSFAHWADRGAYFWWRLGQGELRRGLATRMRRLRGLHDPSNPADMVEYHVVRKGVDEEALLGLLTRPFASVETERYWSTQSPTLQAIGERYGLATTFGIIARDRKPHIVGSMPRQVGSIRSTQGDGAGSAPSASTSAGSERTA